jgi:UDP-4-amino-4-deoxy-L-arabinose formyltransferase/UDP-glucuronic acid dehydrogenase (UDP-4-keto-hexauronic acid decarboxylating)
MKIAIIGRTEILHDTAARLHDTGYTVACILTAKEAPEYTRTAADFRALAEALHTPFAQGPRISDHMDFLRKAAADIAISMNYTGVVPQSVIDLFPRGMLNAHGGDLPRYRGNACQAWAILNGEERIGLCVHKMIGGELDSGDIIARDYFPIDHNTKVTQTWEWLARRTPELMLEAVAQLSRDPDYILEQQSKDPKDALRCYPRKPEDGRIDWSKSAIDVLRLINASNKPYAGAFCDYEGDTLIIWDAELVEEKENVCAVPGQVTRIGDGFIEVACGSGKLRLLTVEWRGELLQPVSFIQSIRKRFG